MDEAVPLAGLLPGGSKQNVATPLAGFVLMKLWTAAVVLCTSSGWVCGLCLFYSHAIRPATSTASVARPRLWGPNYPRSPVYIIVMSQALSSAAYYAAPRQNHLGYFSSESPPRFSWS